MRKAKKIQKRTALVILCWLIILVHPFILTAGVCENAVERCAVEALISGFFGGSPALAAHAIGCAVGYQWCLKYFVPGE